MSFLCQHVADLVLELKLVSVSFNSYSFLDEQKKICLLMLLCILFLVELIVRQLCGGCMYNSMDMWGRGCAEITLNHIKAPTDIYYEINIYKRGIQLGLNIWMLFLYRVLEVQGDFFFF